MAIEEAIRRKARLAHRGDRTGESLSEAGAQVDPGGLVGSRWCGIEGGDRPGLRQPGPALGVDDPLRVLRLAVEGVDPTGQLGQSVEAGAIETGRGARLELDRRGAAAGHGSDSGALVAEVLIDQRAGVGRQDETIGIHRARDDGLAQAGAGVDHQLATASGHRVRGEHHTRDLGVDQLLDHHGECDAVRSDALRRSVADGALGPQGRPAAAYRVEDRVSADHVEVGVLLAGEARAGKILGRGRRADGDGHLVAEGAVAVDDHSGEVVGHRCAEHDLAGLCSEASEVACVGALQRGDHVVEAFAHHAVISRGGDAEARRDGKIGAHQAAEVERLAADLLEGVRPDVDECQDRLRVEGASRGRVIHHTMNYPRRDAWVKGCG